MTSIRREFLGWNRPLLQSAVEWLAQEFTTGLELDLSQAIVVVPGRRAGRRLDELLVLHAQQQQVRLTPPQVVTLGSLPELLYPLQRPLASDLVQQLAWAKVLRDSDRKTLRQIVPRPPADDDPLAWWALGTLLWRQHRELAADGRHFADVARLGATLDGFAETDRWAALETVQASYLRTLDSLGLWDVQTARLVAIKQHEPCTDRELILLGTVDLNQATRQILDLVAEHVTVLIGAPADRADGFDAHGCLVPTAWTETVVEIPEDRIRVCDDSFEQAELLAQELARLGAKFRADEIVVGLADDRLGPYIERQLGECGVTTRWLEGCRLSDSGPCRLLLGAADLLERGRYDEFAAFVRHPDVRLALGMSEGLAELDAAFGRHLPVTPEALRDILETTQTCDRTVELLRAVGTLLSPLTGPARPLPSWSEPLRQWLMTIYGSCRVDAFTREGQVLRESLSKLNEVLAELSAVPASVAPTVSAAHAIRCVVDCTSDDFVPPEPLPNAVELLGWLELPLDDAPAVVVTSFNDRFIPSSLNSDLFLPNELRRKLGLEDNSRRFARDAYAVNLMQQSRGDVVWIVARRDSDGNPLVPSRLLFAIEPERLAARVLRFVERDEPPIAATIGAIATAPDQNSSDGHASGNSSLQVPRPEQIAVLLQRPDLLNPTRELNLRVTAFKDYLACKYRYFLRHELKLGSLDDQAVELDPLAFGSLLHEVLKRFGESAARHSRDEQQVRQCLIGELESLAKQRFGSRRRAAVNVQLKQMESRLEAFARWQVKWRNEGWVIEYVEFDVHAESSPSKQPTLRVDDIAVWLHGRLDRIDRNEKSGEYVILDYKTGDRAQTPEQTHRKTPTEWIDLQLPLYRHLARSLALPSEPLLGYINLPKELGQVAPAIAEWSAEDLQAADEVAKDVVRGIARRDFWPMTTPPPPMFGEFADLCHETVFG